jgi:pyruvate dehydrogenase E2 component (dihydrolipoamide acetyltransferase)
MTDILLIGAGGEYMESAVLVEWHVRPGDRVAKGQLVATVETAKAATEVEAPADGTVAELLAAVGDEVAVGAAIARLAGGDAAAAGETAAAPEPPPAREPGLPRRLPAAFASPLARRLALEAGIDLSTLRGSGPHGRIVRRDVLSTAPRPPVPEPKPEPRPEPRPQPEPGPERGARSGGYRRAMAAQMARTLQIPMFSVSVDCDGTALLAERRRIKAVGGIATVNDLIVFRVARLLARHRTLNAHWAEDRVVPQDRVNIGVAVATGAGLVVPVLHDADRLSLADTATGLRRLRERAEAQSLATAEISGATLTVTNLGGFGVADFVPIVNPPQVAILGVAAFRPTAVFDGARLESRPVARLTMSADHRAVDGADVARFLDALRADLESFAIDT